MKTNFSIVVWMMVVSVLLKMLVLAMNWQFTDYERLAIFGNVFILMTGVFLGIRIYKKQNQNTSFPQDFKAGLRVAAMYAIFMAAFVYTYYAVIDAGYFDLKLEHQIESALEHNQDPANKENLINIEQVRQTGEFVLSPFFQSTITLIGFILLGSFYAGILAFLMRKLRGFGH
jgi:glucan phosphoethanolaminetransferase (alkaline phosphatase superfamily)